ncbi:MAG TPA: FtsX-like permease family protein [Vicinamibacteria bacterium]
MIRHLLKMVWARRRANGLVAAEILVSFVVLLAVSTLGLFYLDNYRQPVGFDHRDVWRLQMDPGRGREERRAVDERREGEVETLRQLRLALGSTPGVVGTAIVTPAPFSQSQWTRGYDRQGRRVQYSTASASDDLAAVLGLTVTRGRYFSREDDAATWEPVVIDGRLARELFGTGDPLGQNISGDRDPQGEPEIERRVVGVIEAYRQEGEFDPPGSYVLTRHRPDSPKEPFRGDLLVRVAPGATAELEERVLETAQAVAPGWSLRLEPLESARTRNARLYLAPVLIVGLVAAFLALMVALGLTGVLWLGVTRRTREIGLRRAKGASAGDIRFQVLGEILVLTTLALLPGIALALQLPLVGALPVRGAVFAASLAISVAGIYLLAVLCGWYPARLATRVEPAEALHYE